MNIEKDHKRPLSPSVSLFSGLCLAALFATSGLSAQTTINFDTPTADTYVRAGDNVNNNYGSEQNIEVRRNSNSSFSRKGYIRFDFGNQITDPVGEASLTLVGANMFSGRVASTVNVYGLNHDYEPGEGQLGFDWGEMELTSANAPWGASSNNVPEYVTLLGTIDLPAVGEYVSGTEYTISTPELTAFINGLLSNGQDSITFILVDSANTGGNMNFASKDHQGLNGPALSVQVIPEPSTVAMIAGLGVFGLALVFRRRRK